MISAFWEEAYSKMFDGALVVPSMHPETIFANFATIGSILSHSFLACGFLPIRIAFPTLCAILLGPFTSLNEELMLSSFFDSLAIHEIGVINKALCIKEECYPKTLQRSLINILSQYGVRMITKPSQLRKLLKNTASYEFLHKPCAAISTMHKGIPNVHAPYWSQKSAIYLYKIHSALNATPAKVLDLLKLPDFENPAEEEVFNYLQRYIGQMNSHHIRHFLRFV